MDFISLAGNESFILTLHEVLKGRNYPPLGVTNKAVVSPLGLIN